MVIFDSMAMCSVCARGEQTAVLVNELLSAQTHSLKEIAAQVGVGFRAVSRHKLNRRARWCPYNYTLWRLEKAKAKRGALARVVIAWPDKTFSTMNPNFDSNYDPRHSIELKAADICGDDILVRVVIDSRLPRVQPPAPDEDSQRHAEATTSAL